MSIQRTSDLCVCVCVCVCVSQTSDYTGRFMEPSDYEKVELYSTFFAEPNRRVSELEFNVPFQREHGYIIETNPIVEWRCVTSRGSTSTSPTATSFRPRSRTIASPWQRPRRHGYR